MRKQPLLNLCFSCVRREASETVFCCKERTGWRAFVPSVLSTTPTQQYPSSMKLKIKIYYLSNQNVQSTNAEVTLTVTYMALLRHDLVLLILILIMAVNLQLESYLLV